MAKLAAVDDANDDPDDQVARTEEGDDAVEAVVSPVPVNDSRRVAPSSYHHHVVVVGGGGI